MYPEKKKQEFVADLFHRLQTEIGYSHKLSDGSTARLYDLDGATYENGIYARITYEQTILSYRHFVPIENFLCDPFFWYAFALLLQANPLKESPHVLMWCEYAKLRCSNYSNVEALITIYNQYARKRTHSD